MWAKLRRTRRPASDVIRGFLVETGATASARPLMHGKCSLRASITSELFLEDCFVPEENLLPGVRGMHGRRSPA